METIQIPTVSFLTGGSALRSSTASAMRIWSFRVAMSSASTVCTIPTVKSLSEHLQRPCISGWFKWYYRLRWPLSYESFLRWMGCCSPVIAMYGMYDGNNTFYVENDGSTYGDYINDIITIYYSYGNWLLVASLSGPHQLWQCMFVWLDRMAMSTTATSTSAMWAIPTAG